MLTPSVQDDAAPLFSYWRFTVAAQPIRHLLFGTPQAVRTTIKTLQDRGYAESQDWSRPISTGVHNEVMCILIRRASI